MKQLLHVGFALGFALSSCSDPVALPTVESAWYELKRPIESSDLPAGAGGFCQTGTYVDGSSVTSGSLELMKEGDWRAGIDSYKLPTPPGRISMFHDVYRGTFRLARDRTITLTHGETSFCPGVVWVGRLESDGKLVTIPIGNRIFRFEFKQFLP